MRVSVRLVTTFALLLALSLPAIAVKPQTPVRLRTVSSGGITLGVDAGTHVVREFWPEITRWHRSRVYIPIARQELLLRTRAIAECLECVRLTGLQSAPG